MEGIVRNVFGGFRAGAATPPVAPAAAPPSGRARAIPLYAPERTLLEVRLAFRAAPGLDARHAARLVLVEMLDRRAAAIRERLGATYGVHAVYTPSASASMIELRGALDPARGAASLAALRADLDELRRGEAFLEDFVHARDAVLAREVAEASDSAALGARLAEMATFDKAPTFADELVKAIGRLGPRDVLALAREELVDAVLVVGGSRGDVDAALSQR